MSICDYVCYNYNISYYCYTVQSCTHYDIFFSFMYNKLFN